MVCGLYEGETTSYSTTTTSTSAIPSQLREPLASLTWTLYLSLASAVELEALHDEGNFVRIMRHQNEVQHIMRSNRDLNHHVQTSTGIENAIVRSHGEWSKIHHENLDSANHVLLLQLCSWRSQFNSKQGLRELYILKWARFEYLGTFRARGIHELSTLVHNMGINKGQQIKAKRATKAN